MTLPVPRNVVRRPRLGHPLGRPARRLGLQLDTQCGLRGRAVTELRPGPAASRRRGDEHRPEVARGTAEHLVDELELLVAVLAFGVGHGEGAVEAAGKGEGRRLGRGCRIGPRGAPRDGHPTGRRRGQTDRGAHAPVPDRSRRVWRTSPSIRATSRLCLLHSVDEWRGDSRGMPRRAKVTHVPLAGPGRPAWVSWAGVRSGSPPGGGEPQLRAERRSLGADAVGPFGAEGQDEAPVGHHGGAELVPVGVFLALAGAVEGHQLLHRVVLGVGGHR